MHRTRSRVAVIVLLGVVFAACLDAPAGVPRPGTLTPLADVSPPGSPVILAAGDVADCTSPGDEATALLLDAIPADAVLALGDLAYEEGTATEFINCYNPTWGRHKARTYPTPGNHEYHTPAAEGYFNYFGAVAGPPGQGYYSYNLGEWHILSLNSNISANAGSAQLTWIRQDLAANPTACSLAYWHHPVASSGIHGNVSRMMEAWRVLDSAGVDVVLVAHDHSYERFAPQTSTGIALATGMRQFVVGTGGSKLREFQTIRENSELRDSDTWGVLKLALNPTSYEWQFVPVAGKTFTDQGTADCVQTTPPDPNQQPVATLTEPSNGATFTAPATITLSATASDADGNLNRVEFYRGTSLIGADATPPYSVTWKNVDAGTYTVTARAVDAAEAWSASPSARLTVNPPPNSAPTVSLTAPLDDANFTAPATIAFEATAADVDGNLSRVEFYNGTTLLGSTTTSPYAFTWTDVPAGIYSLTARAVDAAGAATTSAQAIVAVNAPAPPNSAPTVALNAPSNDATFAAPATITLEASAADVDGNLTRVEFYNGAVLLGSDDTAPYSFTWPHVPAGTYALSARAVDALDAASTSNTAHITVTGPPAPANQPPVANPGGPYTGAEGIALTLNGGGSTDPESDPLSYAWDFGDGTTGTGSAHSKTYADNGTYTVTLVVSDPFGGTHSATTTATISNVPPTATFLLPATAASGAPYTLGVTNTNDVAADLSALQYRFECGGGGFTPWGPAASITCPGLTGPATDVIRAAVRDKDGGMRQQSRNIDILGATPPTNSAPTVSLSAPADGSTVVAPATITIEATAADLDGNLSRVEFYNGTTLLSTDASSPFSFTWSDVSAGTYVLTARAIDAAEATATSGEVRITVAAAPPPNQPPIAHHGGPYTGTEGVALTVHGGGSTDPEGDALTYAWNFGDGTTGTGRSPSKTYADNGTYTITLVVSDPSGGSSTATTTATVANVAPTLTFSSPTSVAAGAEYTVAITTVTDVAADEPGLQFRFECGGVGGYTPWGSARSITCAGLAGPATAVVRAAVRDKDGGMRQQSRNLQVLAAAPPPNQPPVANPGGPYTGTEGFALTVNGQASTDPESATLSYAWDFGDGTTGSGASPTKTYGDNGTYTITLVVTDPAGAAHSATTTAMITNVAPQGTFSAPATVPSGAPFMLAITSPTDVAADLPSLEYRFECGAGFTPWSSASSVTCPAVTGPAARVVRAAIRDKDGDIRQYSQNLDILAPPNEPPVANAGGPYAGTEGVALVLSGAGSSDPEGAALTYAWSFGDGSTGSGASPSKAYADNGTYTITLVVSDPAGASHTATTTATIANAAPAATFAAPATAQHNAAFTLAITNATDVAADLAGLEYRFDCGAGFGAWSASASTTCAGVAGPATRTVRGALRDKDGGHREYAADVGILAPPNQPPVANAGGPYTGSEGIAVTLSAGGSADPEGGPLTYAWSFGDGTTGTGASPSKTYGDNGTYTITLVVSDPAGATHTATTTATIANVLPTLTFVAPATAPSGTPYTLSITSAGDVAADVPTLQYRFECGVGFTQWGAARSVTCPGVTGPATRVVRGAVRDKDGGVRQQSFNLSILAP